VPGRSGALEHAWEDGDAWRQPLNENGNAAKAHGRRHANPAIRAETLLTIMGAGMNKPWLGLRSGGLGRRFVDGSNGGYALAAKQLKGMLREDGS
jgi:hypothetical protein